MRRLNMNTKKEKSLFERVLDNEVIDDKIKKIGSISSFFAEVNEQLLKENFEPSAIRLVTHKDVACEHFADWFFKMDDFVNINPEEFPLSMITHCDEFFVYGYFIEDKLNGIIRVDDCLDWYELSFFFVNPAFQNQGTGQFLFKWILNRFRDKKLVLYVHTDNRRAIHVYRKYGFKIVKTEHGRAYKPDDPYYVMQKN